MASYRFCRTDDLTLLAAAHEACVRPYFPELGALDVAGLKRAAREIDLWASSCMVALVDAEPIAVVFATKREDEALIWRMGVRPGHERQGHGRHLLASLSAKQAILGPPRLVAEVPAELDGARAFFEAAGFRADYELTDFVLREPPAAVASDLVVPVSYADLAAAGVLDGPAPRPWERSSRSLAARAARLSGWAVAAADRFEAHILVEDGGEGATERRIVALGVADPMQAAIWLLALLAAASRDRPGPLRFPRAHPDEVAFERLEALGFAADRVAVRFGAEAAAA